MSPHTTSTSDTGWLRPWQLFLAAVFLMPLAFAARFLAALFLVALLLTPSLILAAPAPLTSSSKARSLLQGLYRSAEGFALSSKETNWIADFPSDKDANLEVIYRAPPSAQSGLGAALTVRIDRQEKPLRLKPYVKSWLKDYPKFGFEVLGSKRFRHKNEWGYVIDLIAPAQKKQLRQVVFVRDQRAVILSCRDDQDRFRESLKSCNQIIRSFAWLD